MKCYNHHEKDAVGVCKNCSKGLCPDCATDVGNGLACRNSCEQHVIEINAIIQKNKKVYNKTSSTYYRTAIIYGLLGLFFIVFPLLSDSELISFLVPIGVIFLIGMSFMIYSGMRFNAQEK